MKKYLLALLLISINVIAQNKDIYEFGKITPQENDIPVYQKDSTANALFLLENGKTVFDVVNGRIVIQTTYYAKIKIFNKEGFINANVEIPIYKDKYDYERVFDIKAVTHNGNQKQYLNKDNIYKEKVNNNWSLVKFTLPNVQEQSIIEYEYKIETPYKYNFKGWEFQGNIPKLRSRFYALIPGNYNYNRRIMGFKKLNINESKIKKKCFSIPGYSQEADCEELTYEMDSIPAFIKEDYMTAESNYLSAIKFELLLIHNLDGSTQEITESWEDVDKKFKTDKDIGRQLRKEDYIAKQLPEKLLAIENNLSKAKAIYKFIKDHFSWNGKERLFTEVNVKDAYDAKVGNSSEINIALINALNAANLNADLVIISTRDNGLPTKLYPVMSDFNYAIAKVDIDGKTYLLDATNKEMPFGTLPVKCLNSYGRVMNFKDGSSWIDIDPIKNTKHQLSSTLQLNEEGNFTGKLYAIYDGYKAINKREKVTNTSEDKYLNSIEDDNEKLIINSYENKNLYDLEALFYETYDVTIENNFDNDIILLNPFLFSRISENPFKLKNRTYPVDFAYPRTFQYNLSLKLPDNYKVKSMPENIALKLPNNSATYYFMIEEKNHEIHLFNRLMIRKTFYTPDEYYYLKEFYNQIIKNQNSLITLEKL